MRLEALEFVERREIGIAVIEMDDETDGGEIVAVMVDERAAAGVIVERPAHAVHDEAGPVFFLRQLP